jgi:hypothetical protein
MEEIYFRRRFIMKIQKGDKTVEIPNWALFVGAMVVEEAMYYVAKVKNNKNILKYSSKKGKES